MTSDKEWLHCPAREAGNNREERFKKILKRTIENNKDLLIELGKRQPKQH